MKRFYTHIDGECVSIDSTAAEVIESVVYFSDISEEAAAEAFEMAEPFGAIKNASGRALHPSEFPGVRIWFEETEE